MTKVRTKGAFVTKAKQIIAKEAGEIICMPDEDYEEVKDLCEVIEEKKKVKKSSKILKSKK